MDDEAAKRLREAVKEESSRFELFYRWLEENMPKIFFTEVSQESIFLIVHSLMGFREQDYCTELHTKNMAIAICLDTPDFDVKILEHYPLYGIKSYTTYLSKTPPPLPEVKKNLRVATVHFTEAAKKEVEDQIDPAFLRKLAPQQRTIALEMFERAKSRDNCQYDAQYDENWEAKGALSMHLILAWKNVPKHNFLYRLAKVVFRHDLVMQRVSATYINPYRANSILLLSIDLHGAKGGAAWEETDISDFLQEVVTLKYFGSADDIEAYLVNPGLIRGNLGNLLRTMMNFIHQVLVNVDPNLYTLETIEEALCRHPELTIKLLDAFEHKFHPARHDFNKFAALRDEYNNLVTQLDTGHEFHDLRRRNILQQGMNFVTHVLKTNFYQNNKTAFAFRLDCCYLDFTPFDRKKLFPELPFGLFYIKGMHFLAFHIRFKDLARGGLRTIYPDRKERMLAERNTVFIECYNLAYTQHKKNKDLPEGGAKGVIFLKPYERLQEEAAIYAREMGEAGVSKEEIDRRIEQFKQEQKLEYLYETQRSFITTLLTLINCDPDGKLRAKNIVDYWGQPEYIYLGPDENLHNKMIEWIAEESKRQGYKPGGAFISGKPKVGINHKQYGVTSLGVNTYMHEVLQFLGIDPEKHPFTIKMTGGPDGDVAGNQILNLYRHYPETAKLIALTDISGTIYDPQGLDLAVCAQMFHEGQSIRFYPPEKLSSGGFLLDRESRREFSPYIQQTLCWRKKENLLMADWISGNEMNAIFRNNVHKAKTDIFLPCGGRPRALNETNYTDFLDDKGEPTSKAIVEGANLYLSPRGRRYLEEKGVLIIKDSSANKGGVICSSFEILCGLTLSDEEFLEHKKELVPEILQRIQECALEEAHLLLSTFQNKKTYLTELSDEVSTRINMFTDQLLNYLETIELSNNNKDLLVQCFLLYCPKTLREKFEERLLEEIPENHKKAIIACRLAARLVYRRGLEWFPSLVEILPLLLIDPDLIY